MCIRDRLYSVAQYSGKFTVYKVKSGLLYNDKTHIGTAKSMEGALALIKVHSGREIKSVNY